MWDDGLTPLIEIFLPNNMNDTYLGRSIEIFAPCQITMKDTFPSLVIKGIILKYYTFNKIQTGINVGINNCITIETLEGITETVIYGQDFELFRKYKEVNKKIDHNKVLEYMRTDSLRYRFIGE